MDPGQKFANPQITWKSGREKTAGAEVDGAHKG